MPELPPLREVIARHGLQARHGLGQHFLLDGNLTDRIVRVCGPLSGVGVLEVGPGPGGLTRSLLAAQPREVVAVELDGRAVGALAELQAAYPGKLNVLQADARGVDAAALLAPPRLIAANLPYNVATPLLIGWLRQAASYERLILMFQLEVAERMCAAPGEPAYGRLSVLVRLTCRAELVLRLPPAAFTPPPAVQSAVVRLTPHTVQPTASLLGAVERLTQAAFGQRRKMLRRALAAHGGEDLLRAAGIDPQLRAEMLDAADFARLAAITVAAPPL